MQSINLVKSLYLDRISQRKICQLSSTKEGNNNCLEALLKEVGKSLDNHIPIIINLHRFIKKQFR
jgi:hypothetical protein